MARASNSSVVLSVSNIGQLQAMYPDVWDSASDSMDSLLYLGSDDTSTIDYTAKCILNSKTLDKPLTEITTGLTLLKEDECIVMIRGIQPFKDKKV
jgi:type IV secretory pathway TraG/TraD family ATPase VirD4